MKILVKCPHCGYDIQNLNVFCRLALKVGNLSYCHCPNCDKPSVQDPPGTLRKPSIQENFDINKKKAENAKSRQLNKINKAIQNLAPVSQTDEGAKKILELEEKKKEISEKFSEKWNYEKDILDAKKTILGQLGITPAQIQSAKSFDELEKKLKRKNRVKYQDRVMEEKIRSAKKRKLGTEKEKQIREEHKKKREEAKPKAKHFLRPSRYEPEFREKLAPHIMKAFPSLILLLLGVFVSLTFGSDMFFYGFLAWSIYVILPKEEPLEFGEKISIQLNPGEFKESGKNAWKYAKAFAKSVVKKPSSGLAIIKTFAKIGAIVFFILGVRGGAVPFQNIALIVVAFIGYYSLKMEYNPLLPSEILEAVLKFGIGVLVIPFWIFYTVFDSLALAFIALAFFAIPPISAKEKKSEVEIFAMTDFMGRILFLFIMVFVIAGVMGWFGGAGWELKGALKYTFWYFWAVCGIAGLFSSTESRPVTGFVMLGAATVIFGLSPGGTQEVGQALLGQWFPTVYTTATNIMKPISDAFAQLATTFGTGFSMITNPVAFAQQMMNGTYTRDPTSGVAGAFGVEIEEMRITPIYPYQPYSFIVKLKNKGAFEANNVGISIESGQSAPRFEKDVPDKPLLPTIETPLGAMMPIRELGFITGTVKTIPKMPELDVRQEFFESEGVKCSAINSYELREKFIPIKASIEYEYSIDSSMSMEFMDESEWERRVDEGILITQTKKPATLTNAPVKLNMDAPEQPIREGNPFFIGLYLTSAQKGETEVKDPIIELQYPIVLEGSASSPDCTPIGHYSLSPDGNTRIIVWSFAREPYLIYCHFEKIPISEPTKTIMVKASADYTFNRTESTTTKIEFGGGCCSEDDCPGDMKCTWDSYMDKPGECVPKQ